MEQAKKNVKALEKIVRKMSKGYYSGFRESHSDHTKMDDGNDHSKQNEINDHTSPNGTITLKRAKKKRLND